MMASGAIYQVIECGHLLPLGMESCDSLRAGEVGYFTASIKNANRRLHPAGPLSFGEKDAKSRVKNILGFRKPGVWAAVGGTLMILVIAAVCLTNGTGGADGAGTDKAEINGTEINSAGINGTEETAGTPETAGTVNRTEDGQPESSMSQEGSREDAVLPDIHEVMGRVFENCWVYSKSIVQ